MRDTVRIFFRCYVTNQIAPNGGSVSLEQMGPECRVHPSMIPPVNSQITWEETENIRHNGTVSKVRWNYGLPNADGESDVSVDIYVSIEG